MPDRRGEKFPNNRNHQISPQVDFPGANTHQFYPYIMNIFLTGASGRVGSHIIPHLVSRGHTVTGLVRSPQAAKKIEALGATAVIGDIADRELLKKHARESDGVVHCALNHKTNNLDAEHRDERVILDLLADELEGSGKALVLSSGSGTVRPGQDEHSPSDSSVLTRAKTEQAVLAYKDRGIRSIVVRLAMNTHSADEIHMFEALLLRTGKQTGFLPYLEGVHWSACHADDAGLLYVLALETAKPGTVVHAVQEFPELKEIVEVLGRKTNTNVKPITKDQIHELNLGMVGIFLQLHQDFSTTWTRQTFGWEPKGQLLIDELNEASSAYFQAA
ncbi:Flavonol reductase/cinnamoyl-CoA reductase [Phaffia rhodozyma]|uniref:Flavonol reductase/cinnamoyl-CoA reductase n=1 Tax=Phaffia rhodozyma TaxID=264483 RepID=A0A0F7STJ2_PHARH|nr:Flavonol reductase/cinnamoyl-CoA reductase [Phaffia rhodozyma]